MPRTPLRVAEVWRYPVKSLLGERLPAADVDSRGLAGDRLYAVEDANGKFGSGKTTRRFRLLKGLFGFAARTHADAVLVRLPDGRELPVGTDALDEALSSHYGEQLRVTPEEAVSHFDAGAVHVLTTASLRWLAAHVPGPIDVRRFRPNLLVDAPGASLLEDGWTGAELHVDGCVLRVTGPAPRCVMVNNAQQELPYDARMLRAITRLNATNLGVYAEVVVPGRVGEGAPVAISRPL